MRWELQTLNPRTHARANPFVATVNSPLTAESYRLFGEAILDNFRGHPGRFFILRDDGLRDPHSFEYLFAGYRKWPDAERRAVRWARGRVLDIGCGAGRAALYLQRKGLEVVGIDSSPEAVECARLRGVRDVREVDACTLRFPPRSFDTLLMLGNNFGICGDFAATRRFLRRVGRIVRPKGYLIASTRTPGSWTKQHSDYVKANVRAGRPPGLVRLRFEYRGRKGSWLSLLLVSPDDLLRLCEATGWDVLKIIPGPQGIGDYAFVAARQ